MDKQSSLFVDEVPQVGTGTLLVGDDDFVSVALKFAIGSKHPKTGVPMIDWVKELPGSHWDGEVKRWIVPDVADIPRGWLRQAGIKVANIDGTPARPSDFIKAAPVLEPLPDPLDEVPDWFGYNVTTEPYKMQCEGARDLALGKNFLADDPGLGKTTTSLCTAALLQSRRTLVTCPPGVMEHWARSAVKSGLPAAVGGSVAIIKPTGKVPDLPETGVVITSSSLVANRYDLELLLESWQPTLLIYDESHNSRTFSSKQARVLRRLSRYCTKAVPASGTAAMATPLELAAQLDISGKLEPLFGSFTDYRARFMRKTMYGWKPNKSRLHELREILDEQVWVRRTKVSKKKWKPQTVDIDTEAYEESLSEVYASIDEWLIEFQEENGRFPSNDKESPDGDEVGDWSFGRGDITSRLRQAAGLAKVPAAARIIARHFAQHPQNEDGTWPEPLIVWAHHHSVIEAMNEAAKTQGFEPKIIDGTVSTKKRTLIEDEFQAGRVPLLIGSIIAAGVGITLTRSYKSLFVEIDWTPANMIQAGDRQDRIGQMAEWVFCKLMIAKGTIDERMTDVLFGKSSVLEILMGGDWEIVQQVNKRYNERVLSSKILAELVVERIKILSRTAVSR